MQWYEILCLIGVPSLSVALIIGIVKWCQIKIRQSLQESEAIRGGVQALLRDRLLQEYDKHKEAHCATVSAKENFENMYNRYHALGKNGVMDGVHEEFMELPTEVDG